MMGLQAWNDSDSEENEDLSSDGVAEIKYDFVADDIEEAVEIAAQ